MEKKKKKGKKIGIIYPKSLPNTRIGLRLYETGSSIINNFYNKKKKIKREKRGNNGCSIHRENHIFFDFSVYKFSPCK